MVDKYQIPELSRPDKPDESLKVAFANLELQNYLSYDDIIDQIPSTSKFARTRPVSMELLPMNEGCGQSTGYTLYRKQTTGITNGTIFKAGPVKDFGILIVDGMIQPYPTWDNSSVQWWLNTAQEYTLPAGVNTLDLMIENMGRVNFGNSWHFIQHKGLLGKEGDSYHLNDMEITDIEIIALEFKSNWVKKYVSSSNTI
jgi:beta-galactosidase-like protein